MFRVAPGDQAPGSFARTAPLLSSPAYCKAFDAYLRYGELIRLEAGHECQGGGSRRKARKGAPHLAHTGRRQGAVRSLRKAIAARPGLIGEAEPVALVPSWRLRSYNRVQLPRTRAAIFTHDRSVQEDGAPGRTRTSTPLRTTDFESVASTIPPLGLGRGTWGKRLFRSTGPDQLPHRADASRCPRKQARISPEFQGSLPRRDGSMDKGAGPR